MYERLSLSLYKWRKRLISDKNFIIIASIVVGLIAGTMAVILKYAVHTFGHLLQVGFDVSIQNYLYFFYPAIGILLTVVFVKYALNGKLGRGIGNILYSISRKGGLVERDKTYSHVLTSFLTVGMGGSAGLEAPIVVTGSAIGSNTATFLRMTPQERILLLGCGAASGIAAIFNTPLAGVIFVVEVLLAEFTIPAFIPLLISSATATIISHFSYDGQLFLLVTTGWDIEALPYYILLGLLTGLVSAYMTRITIVVEGRLAARKDHFRKAIFGGLGLGFIIFIFPPLYGEGYMTIQDLFDGHYERMLNNSLFYELKSEIWFLLLFSTAMIFLKVFATSITIGCGGNGGIFAPSLFVGALVGYTFSTMMNYSTITSLNTSNFIAVGMAGILSGVIHAPLTGIFLIAEITGGYSLFIPLMIVSALSYFTTRYFEPFSVYTKKLVEKGMWMAPDKDKSVLTFLKVENLIERDFVAVYSDQTLGHLVEAVSRSKRNIFPVLDHKGHLLGVISLNGIRDIMFERDKYDSVKVDSLMETELLTIDKEEEMKDVMKKFEQKNVWNIPVLESGKYIGFVSKSAVFTQYRKQLIETTKQFSSA